MVSHTGQCTIQHTSSNSGSIPPSMPNSLSPLPDAKPAGTPSSPSAIGVDFSISLKICGPGGIVTIWLLSGMKGVRMMKAAHEN